MNLQEMIDFVRTQADTDENDAPESTLTVYARLAYNDIRRRVPQWDFLMTTDTLSTTANDPSYPLSGLTGGNIEYVTQVIGETEQVHYMPWTDYMKLTADTISDVTQREADYFTVQAGVIYLYPTPSTTAVTYTVHGYRNFTSWPVDLSTESDLPREFDEAICMFMLSKYYLGQEDIELSRDYMRDYETLVGRFVASKMRRDMAAPKYKGGFNGRLSYSDWVRRMVEG